MSLEHIPVKIRFDAAMPIFLRGSRLFNEAVAILSGKVNSRNKLRVALCYFEIADSIVPEATNVNHKGLCLKFLGRYEECIRTYRRFYDEPDMLCNSDVHRKLADETIAYCQQRLKGGVNVAPTEEIYIEPINEPECVAFARNFGEALVDGDYDIARGMLSAELKQKYSKRKLQTITEKLIGDRTTVLGSADVVETMDQWSDKQESDVGWVYVALTGSECNEAVALTISKHFSELVISGIEWGRP